MQDDFERLIEELRRNQSIRATIPQTDIDRIRANTNIENEDEYWLLAEYLKYLKIQKREKDNQRTDELIEQIHNVERYLLEAQFGDRNIGRFNKPVLRDE